MNIPIYFFPFLLGVLAQVPLQVDGDQCIADSAINDIFIPPGETQIPLQGSCCQADVCGLACPEEVSPPAVGKRK